MLAVKKMLSTDNIIKISPEDTLSSTLSKLSTSHDAAFVFGRDDNFMGIINPYYCLIQSSYPGNAKVEHCLYHPPKVAINDSFEKIAQLFIGSKVHYLPVFDNESKFAGIISANKLLDTAADNFNFKINLREVGKNKNRPLITIYETDPISTAINLYKQHKISKLVVIGKDMKLRGILSYYDLIYFLVSPKEKLHQGEREGNKIAFYHQPVKNFFKTNVITLNEANTMWDALKLVLEKKIGSVVVVDQEKHPVYIITKRDFLNLIAKTRTKKPLQVVSKSLSFRNKEAVKPFFDYLLSFTTKLPGVAKAKIVVKEDKGGGVFKVVLSLITKKGPIKVITREGKNLKDIINDVREKLGYKK